MGMTIEDIIQGLKETYMICCSVFAYDRKKYIDVAIDTMRKYQKIEQIASDFKEYQKGISCGFGGEVYMQMVSEVVEDGKID